MPEANHLTNNMIKLYEFQKLASTKIQNRFSNYIADPVLQGTLKDERIIPFIQKLDSITGSGKTVILADAIKQMSEIYHPKPLIFWMSESAVVVEQTLKKLSPGGDYYHLLGNMLVADVDDYEANLVRNDPSSIIYLCTVDTFNRKEKDGKKRKIFRDSADLGNENTWESLKKRGTFEGIKRKLFIVYDEAQNLTDQQTELLWELSPDALLLATATMRLPRKIEKWIETLQEEKKWKEEDLLTYIDPLNVIEEQLVKERIILRGHKNSMEDTVSALINDFKELNKKAEKYLSKQPKVIYVCRTNLEEGASRIGPESAKQRFETRKAPPILIWRHLTEKCGIEPSKIAVYSKLNFSKNYPPPRNFKLFKGGDKDYKNFVAGDFQHIIFNLSLQEGWDEPLVYFCYIDKTVNSRVMIEQIIGRVLRQPASKYYPSPILNSGYFYIQVDKQEIFQEVFEKVKERLEKRKIASQVYVSLPGKAEMVEKEAEKGWYVPQVSLDPTEAITSISKIVDGILSHTDKHDIEKTGERIESEVMVGKETKSDEVQWKEFKRTKKLTVRTILMSEIVKECPGAYEVFNSVDRKFDNPIDLESRAHQHLKKDAQEIIQAYEENIKLKYDSLTSYQVKSIMVQEEIGKYHTFKMSLHEGYSNLNEQLELPFARELDRWAKSLGFRWCRNNPRSGYGIPLINRGITRNFYPDFLIWKNEKVLAVDTTGSYLLDDKITRKLLNINPSEENPSKKLVIQIVSPGKYKDKTPTTKEGFTTWKIKENGEIGGIYYESLEEAIKRSLN